ncbi:importin-13 [Schistocerca cancellata]|uniref:importin-13 n=1 Tax=Schistocerca cancellata TaxID=274614 RepID=UPI0021176CB3|nr:importin-13 [Schistocerca cancellata]
MEFTSEGVEKAVTVFYTSRTSDQAEAHRWLTEAQASTTAWKFVWELLDPSKLTEVQFFGAITLHSKIVKWWHEIPIDQYTPLRNQILGSIASHCSGPKIVLSKLCAALAAYIINVTPEHWPNPINELIQTFLTPSTTVPAERTAWILMEILTMLPDELNNSRIGAQQKGAVLACLRDSVHRVVEVVRHCLSDASFENANEVKEHAASCAVSWLRIGMPIAACEGLALDLLNMVLQNATSDDYTESSQSLIEAALNCLESLVTHPDTHLNPKHVQRLMEEILKLEVLLGPKWHSADEVVTSKIYRLFVGMGECHSKLILRLLLQPGSSKVLGSKIVENILRATSIQGVYPVEECISVHSLGFWYILQEDVQPMEGDERTDCITVLSPIYCTLVEVLLKKSALPPDIDEWNSDDREKLRWYRQDVADTLMYCYQILHDQILELLLHDLSARATEFEESWQPVEANLHAWMAIAELVPNVKPQIGSFFMILQNIPISKSNIKVFNAAIDCMGAYADWININPSFLSYVIPTVMSGLENTESAPSSSMALKDLSRDCQLTIQQYADNIIRCIQAAIISGSLGHAENIRLMYALGRLLSPMPLEKIMMYLNEILVPCVRELEILANSEDKGMQTYSDILLRLKMMSTIFATLDTSAVRGGALKSDDPQPVLLILEKVFPVLETITCKWCTDEEIMKAMCTLLKQAVSTLLEKFEIVLPPVVNMLMKSFRVRPQPSVLELLQQIVILFGRDTEHTQMIHSLVTDICRISMTFCFSSPSTSEHCDVIESFFNLLSQLIKKIPKLFLMMDVEEVKGFFRSGIESLQLPETPVLKASATFLKCFIKQSWEYVHFSTIVNDCGEALVQRILLCIGGNCPRTMIDHLADLLMMLNRKQTEMFARWLTDNVSAIEFPGHGVSQNARAQFVQMVLRERANKRKLQEIVRGFTLICRGLAGTEFGGQLIIL